MYITFLHEIYMDVCVTVCCYAIRFLILILFSQRAVLVPMFASTRPDDILAPFRPEMPRSHLGQRIVSAAASLEINDTMWGNLLESDYSMRCVF